MLENESYNVLPSWQVQNGFDGLRSENITVNAGIQKKKTTIFQDPGQEFSQD